jgi:hypothetical protein
MEVSEGAVKQCIQYSGHGTLLLAAPTHRLPVPNLTAMLYSREQQKHGRRGRGGGLLLLCFRNEMEALCALFTRRA